MRESQDLDTWFKREILPHEAALMRYLTRVWSNRSETHDLRQDAYIRIYEAAKHNRPLNPRSFLFATARNLVTDRIRHARIISIETVSDPEALNVLTDELTPERRAGAWQDLKRAARALNQLSPKCREIIWLRRVDNLSIKEIAEHLHVSSRTVENQVFRGMKALGNLFHSDVPESSVATNMDADTENRHG